MEILAMTTEYKTYVRVLGECVRKPEWRPRGIVEIQFLRKTLMPVFDELSGDAPFFREEVEYAMDQLEDFFKGRQVDHLAASIYAYFLQYVLDPVPSQVVSPVERADA
jgi:hypothetical protein